MSLLSMLTMSTSVLPSVETIHSPDRDKNSTHRGGHWVLPDLSSGDVLGLGLTRIWGPARSIKWGRFGAAPLLTGMFGVPISREGHWELARPARYIKLGCFGAAPQLLSLLRFVSPCVSPKKLLSLYPNPIFEVCSPKSCCLCALNKYFQLQSILQSASLKAGVSAA